MKTKFALFLFLFSAFAVSALAQSPTPTPKDDEENIFTEEIKLNVFAVNSAGNFAPNVKAEDVVINEDNVLHQADTIRRIPANVLLVLDTGGELRMAKSIDQTRNTAISLIDTLREDDSIAVIEYSDKANILAEWTSDKTALKRLLKDKLNFGRRSTFVDAMKLANDFLRKSKVENQHLVLITDGTDSLNDRAERNAAFRELLASSVSVHIVSYTRMETARIEPKSKRLSKSPPPKAMPDEVAAQLPNGVRDFKTAPKIGQTINTDRAMIRKMNDRKFALKESEEYLAALADDTSGQFVLPETIEEMIEKTALVARVIDSNYVITYTPKRALSESKSGEIRSIEVTSKRPGLQVQARRKLIIER
jgi:VWFA-related protein